MANYYSFLRGEQKIGRGSIGSREGRINTSQLNQSEGSLGVIRMVKV